MIGYCEDCGNTWCTCPHIRLVRRRLSEAQLALVKRLLARARPAKVTIDRNWLRRHTHRG